MSETKRASCAPPSLSAASSPPDIWHSPSGPSTAGIVLGSVVLAIVLALLAIAIIFTLWRRRSRHRRSHQYIQETMPCELSANEETAWGSGLPGQARSNNYPTPWTDVSVAQSGRYNCSDWPLQGTTQSHNATSYAVPSLEQGAGIGMDNITSPLMS